MSKGRHLTDAERDEIMRLANIGYRQKQIALMIGRSEFAVGCVVRGRRPLVQAKAEPRHYPKFEVEKPQFRPPRTGSDSGFIRPLNYDLLVSGRAR